MTSPMARSTLRPNARTSPPLRIAIASPMPCVPLTRNIGCMGSAGPRVTCAMSPRRMIRPFFATKLTPSTSCSDWNAPETRMRIFSLSVCTMPAGITAFCACSPATSAARSMPSPASCFSRIRRRRARPAHRGSLGPASKCPGAEEATCGHRRAEPRSPRPVKPSAVKPYRRRCRRTRR